MSFPTPYSGTYYPIYNSGIGQYIEPTAEFPFDRVSTLLVAFAHAYPVGNNNDQAQLTLEEGQPYEPERLTQLVKVARSVNPNIKILISLGWGHNDWTYISQDYNGQRQFPQSVIDLILKYDLDGFDIDDESIGGTSGQISQQDFTGVAVMIRHLLDEAAIQNRKPYYFTITPAGGTPYITNDNILIFDIINTQNYGNSSFSDFSSFPNANPKNFAFGINCSGCGSFPPFPPKSETDKLAGMFSWNMSADSPCVNQAGQYFKFTRKIADQVGYQN